jgi:hypothetical protein
MSDAYLPSLDSLEFTPLNIFPSRCTILNKVAVVASGAQNKYVYVENPGLTNLECAKMALISARPTGTEKPSDISRPSVQDYHPLIRGMYLNIDTDDRVEVDNVVYQIVSVEHMIMTRLRIMEVKA